MASDFIKLVQWANSQGDKQYKLSQQQLEKEYERIRYNLERSIKKYQRRGLDTSFFEMPARPSKITEGSIRKLEKKLNEWKYLTGGNIDYEKISPTWSRASEEVRNFRVQNRQWLNAKTVERNQQEALNQMRAEVERNNQDNSYYKQALAEGYTIEDLVTDSENYALKLLQIAEDALYSEDTTRARYRSQTKRKYNRQKEYKFTKNQLALFSVVKKKAQLSINQFMNMGIPNDKNAMEEYSYNLQKNFYEISKEFEEWLWESDQWSNPIMKPLELVVKAMTKDTSTSGRQKKQFANMIQEESI